MMKAVLLTTMMFVVVFTAPLQIDTANDIFFLCDGHPADIFFLLDSSSSIWIVDYAKQLNFIQQIVDYFPVSPTQTRFGVGLFADNYVQKIGFGDFDNADELKVAIGNIRKHMGGTSTGLALRSVREQAFRQARQNSGHVLVVLTDGESRNVVETREEAAVLKAEGVHIFAIGIGLSRMDELVAIGSSPRETFVHDVTDFNVLNQIRETLAFEVCKVEAPKHEPYCSAGMDTDVMFAYDATGMGSRNARHVQKFIGDTIQNFGNMDDGTIQTGIMSGQCAADNIDLDEFSDKNSLASFVRNVDIQGLDQIVRDLQENSYRAARGGRVTARRLVVLIVNDNVEKINNLATEMKIAKAKKDIQFVVVAIGDSSLFDVLRALVMKPSDSHFLSIPTYDGIEAVTGHFVDTLCEGFKVPSIPSPTPDRRYYNNFNDIVPISNMILDA